MKSVILLPVIVVLVVVAAVAVIEVTGVDLFKKSPEGGLVETAITELLDTKTFKVNGKIEVDVEASVEAAEGEDALSVLPGVSSVKMFINVSSEVEQRKNDNLKTSSNINIGVDAGGMSMAGIVEAITVGSALYVKLVSVPSVLSSFLGDIENIRNQWVEIDLGAIEEQYKEAAEEAGVDLDEKELNQQLKDLFREVKELITGKTLFDITQELGVEEVNEISTERYFVTANKEAVKELMVDYTELTKKYISTEQKAEYDKKLQEAMQSFTQNFDEVWERIGGISFDVWVEKRTGRLVRVLWRKHIDPSNLGDVPEEIEGIGVELDFSFSDFGKRIDIESPSGSEPFEDILSDIISTFAPSGLEVPALPEGF